MSAKTVLVKVTKGNRITIPTEACREVKVGEGDYVFVRWKENKIVVVPAEISPRGRS